jgi:hypothetical protein
MPECQKRRSSEHDDTSNFYSIHRFATHYSKWVLRLGAMLWDGFSDLGSAPRAHVHRHSVTAQHP